MGFAKRGVAAIPGIAQPVVGETLALTPIVTSHGLGRVALVDVITEVGDQIDARLEHVPVGVVIALFVVLTTGHADSQRQLGLSRSRAGPGSTNGAAMFACAKAVVVTAARFEPSHFEVHAVREDCLGTRETGLHGLTKTRVKSDFEAHFDVVRADSAIRRQQIGDQSRPQHHPVRMRIARGDSEQEGIAPEDGRAQPRRGECRRGQAESTEVEGRGENDASIDHGSRV